MKKIHSDDAKQRTQVDFLPVIEGDPNDYRTIFTTLKECMRLSGDKRYYNSDLRSPYLAQSCGYQTGESTHHSKVSECVCVCVCVCVC